MGLTYKFYIFAKEREKREFFLCTGTSTWDNPELTAQTGKS